MLLLGVPTVHTLRYTTPDGAVTVGVSVAGWVSGPQPTAPE
jgi:hypothetical protein